MHTHPKHCSCRHPHGALISNIFSQCTIQPENGPRPAGYCPSRTHPPPSPTVFNPPKQRRDAPPPTVVTPPPPPSSSPSSPPLSSRSPPMAAIVVPPIDAGAALSHGCFLRPLLQSQSLPPPAAAVVAAACNPPHSVFLSSGRAMAAYAAAGQRDGKYSEDRVGVGPIAVGTVSLVRRVFGSRCCMCGCRFTGARPGSDPLRVYNVGASPDRDVPSRGTVDAPGSRDVGVGAWQLQRGLTNGCGDDGLRTKIMKTIFSFGGGVRTGDGRGRTEWATRARGRSRQKGRPGQSGSKARQSGRAESRRGWR